MNKKLDEYTKDELLAYVRQLQKDTKFGLVWNPKQENIVTDCETKVPVLQEVLDKAITKANDGEPTHLLLEGDNYHSLSVAILAVVITGAVPSPAFASTCCALR